MAAGIPPALDGPPLMSLVLRSSQDTNLTGGNVKVLAGGAIPWRISEGNLEVLLIHREKYDDWSWPKGKLDDGETLPQCAVREVQEEVGLRITLGIPLPAIRYPVKAGQKVVYYWAAHVPSEHFAPDGHEVDAARWVSCAEARRQLTNPSDIDPLDTLEGAYINGRLATVPFIVVRHAKAKPRSSWTKEEGKRPLAATGKRQALEVDALLSSWHPERVASSPWTRCIQTVSPYLKRHDLGVKLVPALTEHEAKRRPSTARKAVLKLLNKGVPQAVCTHRPVLPLVFDALAERLPGPLARFLPAADPYLRPGAMVVLHLPVTKLRKPVSVEVFETFDD
ncbi:NUDIX hydrolase [Arthrobacter rhombi]|uniref:NUDIX hydrolase n=1 Tax=Arthrobacter rhombi TaxID=71253 RepID=UPI003FD1687D